MLHTPKVRVSSDGILACVAQMKSTTAVLLRRHFERENKGEMCFNELRRTERPEISILTICNLCIVPFELILHYLPDRCS